MIMGIGIHVIDSAHQFMKLTRPNAAVAGGGIYHFPDRDTPDVINLVIEYPEKLNVTFEAEILTCGMRSSSAGIELRGRGGVLRVHRYMRELGWDFTPNPSVTQEVAATGAGDPSSAEWLMKNWLECIKSREKPIADEVQGYYSCMACFMGLEAYKQRKRIEWDHKWDVEAWCVAGHGAASAPQFPEYVPALFPPQPTFLVR
jgi:predicted dehydrogenase